jgi:glycerophosphoryl diester phosphodiesterase
VLKICIEGMLGSPAAAPGAASRVRRSFAAAVQGAGLDGYVRRMLVPSRTRPLVIAHRGASAHAADNTIEAFTLAVAHGADGVELDVRRTVDDEVVVHHELGIHDFGVFAERSFAELREAHPEVPTLGEALAAVGDHFVDVEIKNDPRQVDYDPTHRVVAAVVERLGAAGREERFMVSCFDAATLDAVRDAAPQLVTGRLLHRGVDLARAIPTIAARGHRWVVAHVSLLRRGGAARVTAAHDAGLLVAVWTVDGRRRLRRLAAAGVDAVVTNDPARALRVYAEG